MKKIGLIVTVACSLVLMAACGNKGEKASSTELPKLENRYELDKGEAAWKRDTKKEVTDITWYLNADWWINTDNFGKDLITKKIEEDLNIKVKFVTGDDTRLNTLFASGDLPDIITLDNMNSQTAKNAPTWAYSLNDLADAYDPYFYESAKSETLKWYEQKDGKAYGYPNFSNTQEDYDAGYVLPTTAFIIRSDVYETIGKPDMSTPEGFLAGLKKIKESRPDLYGFGFNSVVSSASSVGYALQDYMGVPVEDKDGNYYNRNLDKDYLTWLETLNKAYNQGSINDDSFSDDTTAFDDRVKSGKYATIFMDGTTSQAASLQSFKDANPGVEYIAIDGPASLEGRQRTLRNSGLSGWMSSYITNKTKDPAKTIQLFTYMLSEEGQILSNYGIEGETYERTKDDKITILPEVKKLQKENPTEYGKQYNLGGFYIFGNDRYKALSTDNTAAESVQQFVSWGKDYVKSNYVMENTGPESGTAEARTAETATTILNKAVVSMIRAENKADYDKAFKEYQDFVSKKEYKAVEKIINEGMEKNREKLGL